MAKAAMDSGVATRPVEDLQAYKESLHAYSHRTRMFLQPIIDIARRDRERLVYAEGENETVLLALQAVVDEKVASPILIGRPDVIHAKMDSLGLRMEQGSDYEIFDPDADDDRYQDYTNFYRSQVCRRGISAQAAADMMRTNSSATAACMVAKDDSDAMICGSIGRFDHHFRQILDVIGPEQPGQRVSSMTILITPKGPIFLSDTHVAVDPSAEEIVNTTLACAKRVESFGLTPKVALLSHSNFGISDAASAKKMRRAAAMLAKCAPDLEVDGEMHANCAIREQLRNAVNPFSRLKGQANLLIMPNLDSASIAMHLIRSMDDSLLIGPILSGTAQSAHMVTTSSTAKGIFNMSAIAVADAWKQKQDETP